MHSANLAWANLDCRVQLHFQHACNGFSKPSRILLVNLEHLLTGKTALELPDEEANDFSWRVGEEFQLLEKFHLIPDGPHFHTLVVFETREKRPGHLESISSSGQPHLLCFAGLSTRLDKSTSYEISVAKSVLNRDRIVRYRLKRVLDVFRECLAALKRTDGCVNHDVVGNMIVKHRNISAKPLLANLVERLDVCFMCIGIIYYEKSREVGELRN